MGLKLFGRGGNPAITLGAAMMALVTTDTVSAEQVDAANQELETAGIAGAQLVPSAVLEELTTKADRVDAAEKAATEAKTALDTELKAAGVETVAALVAERDAAKAKADELGKKAGALHSKPALKAGESDVEDGEPDENQKAIDELPHNKALAGHPLFG